MSQVKAFFSDLEGKAEAVARRLFHILRATGGEHGHALVDAIEHDVSASLPSAAQFADQLFKTAQEIATSANGKVSASGVVQVLDSMIIGLGEEAQKELQARLACRIQGLNPDEKLHPGAQSTAPTTQPVDANGAPV